VQHLDSSLVMAEQSVHDVVDQTMSVGDRSPSDAHENNQIETSTVGKITTARNKIDVEGVENLEQDDQLLESNPPDSAITNGGAHVRFLIVP
jgi:hypothetical protein